MKILIVGYGFVGTATHYLFERTDAIIYIHDPAKGYTNVGGQYDYIFLCVPTDLDLCNQRLNINLLRDVFNEWKHSGQIVIRSTIGPNQVGKFPGAIMMPEFLRENHWKEDVDDPELPLIVSDKDFSIELHQMFSEKKVYCLSAEETMMFKLARNSALAMKVAVANEFAEICNRLDIDYTAIQNMLEDDPAVGGTHWQCPGPDGRVGFGGKCLPKDLTHMKSLCYNSDNIFKTALVVNANRRKGE